MTTIKTKPGDRIIISERGVIVTTWTASKHTRAEVIRGDRRK